MAPLKKNKRWCPNRPRGERNQNYAARALSCSRSNAELKTKWLPQYERAVPKSTCSTVSNFRAALYIVLQTGH